MSKHEPRWQPSGQHGDLVPVHGGLAEPVDRVVPLSERGEVLARGARGCRRSARDAAPIFRRVHRLADGALSPLEGPMDGGAGTACSTRGVVVRGGKRYAWAHPALAAGDGRGGRGSSRAAASAALRDEAGERRRRRRRDRGLRAGTSRTTCSASTAPSVSTIRAAASSRTTRARSSWAARCARCRSRRIPSTAILLSPRLARARIRDRKWQRALAFQTRNPLHRAHEYALVAGAERLTREGYFTGVVLNPLVGELKGDDVPARDAHALLPRAARSRPARRRRQGRGAVAGAWATTSPRSSS